MWPAVVLTIVSASPDISCACHSYSTATAQEVTGTAAAATSPNFEVQCHPGCCDARLLARTSEHWRNHLRNKWLGQQQGPRWNPRCVVVVHSRRESYVAAVGRGRNQSFGSTWIDARGEQISGRRVDLLMDREGRLSALGHELTHVVVADAFPGEQPPSWANEGMALLADSSAKQAAHARDVTAAHRARIAFHCAELLALEGYPSSDRIPAFYGQSVALVGLLSDVGKPSDFLPFLRAAQRVGYDEALRETYGIAGVSDLQHLCQAGGILHPPRTSVAQVTTPLRD